MRLGRVFRLLLIVLLVTLIGCSGGGDERRAAGDADAHSAQPSAPTSSPSSSAAGSRELAALPQGVREPPEWLGQRVLPRGPDGFGIADGTPPVLRDRRFRTVDLLPPPRSERFLSSIGRVPKEVLRRSTWQPRCPVRARDLSYVTVSFWGFDRRPHTGELIVHRSVAKDIVRVFERLHRARWPIEEMRVTAKAELDAPPTGDGNNTGAFVCRPARGSSEWSQHAYGLAVDINPFQNPYVRGDVVLPELASAYANRTWRRPGMIRSGDAVTDAFDDIGWGWGGRWTSSKDWMHFSSSGR